MCSSHPCWSTTIGRLPGYVAVSAGRRTVHRDKTAADSAPVRTGKSTSMPIESASSAGCSRDRHGLDEPGSIVTVAEAAGAKSRGTIRQMPTITRTAAWPLTPFIIESSH